MIHISTGLSASELSGIVIGVLLLVILALAVDKFLLKLRGKICLCLSRR